MYDNLTFQIDPLASMVAILALLVAMRANRRSAKIIEDDRNRAGNVSRVAIHEHYFQKVIDYSPATPRRIGGTAQRDAGDPEGFICSVYSGDTEAEVESVYLNIVFIRGLFGQERWEIRLDIQSSEGIAVPSVELPFRMKQNSRLDWIFPTFVILLPGSRGRERRAGVMRLMTLTEQLRFEFGAYSRASAAPSVAVREHRHGILGLPIRRGPWTRVVRHSSLWDALTDPACPDSLKGWFLEWLECRADFQDRVTNDKSERFREWFHHVVYWNYWPPGRIDVGLSRFKAGDPQNDDPQHRRMRTFLALPDMSPIDSGRTVSGPGGSSDFSQFRMARAMAVLSGKTSVSLVKSESTDWLSPTKLTPDDPIIVAATEARRLGDSIGKRQLSRQEGESLKEHLTTLSIELSRCTYGRLSECENFVLKIFNG